jgi:hypothetical protein
MIGGEKYKLNSKTLLRGQQETCTQDTYGLNKKASLLWLAISGVVLAGKKYLNK